jgi:hypothetical protein
VLIALTVFIVPTFAFASVTVSGTTTFASLDGGPDDADHSVNGVFTVNGDLTVNGTINCNDATSGAGSSACPMQFVVTGNLTLAAGSGVFAENRASDGNGANIMFTVGGNVLIQGTTLSTPGAIVSSSKLNGGNNYHAGNITFNAGGTVTQEAGSILAATAVDSFAGAISITSGATSTLGGQILAGCSRTLTPSTFYSGTIMGGGGGGHYVGGPITIRSMSHTEPGLVITSTAIIASQGSETLPVTGNPVILEACGVQVNGLVASLAGQGSGAGVIVRSGATLTIDSSTLASGTGAHMACIRSDAWHEDAGAMYVKLEAAKDVIVIGPAASSSRFSVTSNPGTTDKRSAGTITVISTGGGLTASGNAFQVSGAHNGDQGGTVNVSTKNDATLSAAAIDASGATSDAARAGGHINVRSYSGALNWTSGVGDVRPVGSAAGVSAGQQGTISLTYCTTISTSGTSFPTNGSPVGVFPTTAQSCSPAAPSLPSGDTLPACNQPPAANNTSATTNEDNSVTITMTASDPDGDSLTFSIVTPPAHGNLSAIFNQTPTSAQVTYTPNANYNGGDSFTFQADDGKGGTSTGSVTITINPVNDPPTFNLGANPVSSNEDAGPQTIANYASSISPGPTADESSQTVTFTVTNDNNALFSAQPAISSNGTLTYTSAPNANGSANITVVAHDNGGTANGGNDTSTTHNFNIIINAVNDAPSFTPGSNVTVLDTDGAYGAAWATSISAGPPDESGQTLNFIVSNDDNALFSAQPAISPGGVLSFTPVAGQSGVATVTVQLHDNGGTANGGVDTSAAVTFTITVDKIPVITSANNTTFVVGAFGSFTVTASARPPADIFESGALPSGVTFVNNAPPSSSSGTLSGTPAAGTGGVYNITFTATNVHGSSAPQAFTLTVNEAPTVGTNPSDQTVCAGSTASFTASAATGFPAPTVQWQLSTDGGASFSNIGGATSTTYSFTTSLSDNGHKFRAVFTNGSGSAATTAATLTVNTAPVVTTNPSSQTVCAGATATFTAAATSSPAATVQWQVSTDGGTSFSDVSGATSATYSFTTAATDNGNQYRAVFTNACGSATTTAATLTVDTLPVVTANPVSQTACSGATVTFTAAATSNAGDHTVQWQISGDGGTTWNDISGATSTSYSFVASNADNGKQYRAVFTDACGSTNTSAALLTVDSLPAVTTDPVSQTVCGGANATFTAAATSNAGDQTVQWQVSTNGGATWTNIPGATSTTLSFSTAPGDNGKQYRAVFTDACGSTNTSGATLTVDTLPVVTTNPVSQTVCAGAAATFTASASSNANDHTVQWQVSGDGGTTWNNIPGATSATLSFTTVAGDNGKQYRAVFSDACGSASSSAAALTVDTLPIVTAQPANTAVCAGTTATFTSSATSNANDHTVQWQLSTDGGATFSDIAGATSTTYSFTAASTDDGHQYRAVFTDVCGSSTSNAATLTVNTAPAVTSNPSDTTVCENTIASFTATASGAPAPAVQWQLSTDGGTTWNNIAGATNATYSFTATAADNGNQYRAVFTNTCGTSTTSAATLTVNTTPVVTTNPSDTSVQSGMTASFTAAASGTPSPAVQWQVSTDGGTTFNDIPGATGTTYSFTAQTADSGKKYRAVFTNTCGSATTTAATLTVTCATITVSRTGGGAFPAGTYNTPYTGQSVTASGGSGSYTFAVTAGALPAGLSLSSAGAISGTPTATGTFSFTVTATDTNSSCTGSAAFSIAIRPAALSDSYSNLVNNTEAVVTGGSTPSPATPYVALTGTIVANDQPASGVTAVPGTFATTQGGSVTIAADGTFKYTPPVTASPLVSDSFTYTAVSDTGGTGSPTASNASVSLSLAGRVWYVNNSAATNGNGQSQSPFNTLSAFTSGGRITPDTAGDIIFVHTGDGTTANQNAGVVLLANEQLIGNGVALVVNGNNLVAAGAKPQITNATAASDAVTLNDGNSVKGLTITGATRDGIAGSTHAGFTADTISVQNNTGSGLHFTGMTGSVAVTNATISGNGTGLDVNGGTAAIFLDATNTIGSNAGQRTVSVQNRQPGAGIITLNAAITDNGTGISVINNTGGTVTFAGSQTLNTTTNTAVNVATNAGATTNFTGTLAITTTTGNGFVATAGGTLTITGTCNVTTGAAANGVLLNSVTVSASGATFTAVNTTGATTGVALASLGNGNVSINGGTITGGTTGLSLSTLGTSMVTLSGLTITGAATAISGNSFGTLSIGSGVGVSGAMALSLSSGTVSGTFNSVSSTGDTNGVSLTNVTGSWGTVGGTLTGATGATFNVSGGSGTISWGGAISQANAGNVVTISGGNSNTINFSGNVTSSGASSGLSIGGSSGSYNFNGTNAFSGAGGITIGSGGESGSVSFSSGTSITTAGNAFVVDGTTGNVTAAVTYGGTINKSSAGTLISVNKLINPGSLTMTHSPAASGNLTQNSVGATGISITNSSSANITIANASVTFNNAAPGFTSSGNTGTINLQGLALAGNGNKAGMLISGGGTINVSDGAASSNINMTGGSARAIDGATTSYTGTLNVTNATITDNSAGGVFLTGSTLGGTGSSISGSGAALTLNTVALTNGAGMTSVTSTGDTNGISLTNCIGGTYTVAGGALSGATGATFNVSGGSASFSYGGTISQANGAAAVSIASTTGGTLSFSNNITKSGTAANAVAIAGASGGTINFTGATLSFNTATSAGVNITGSIGAGPSVTFAPGVSMSITTTSGTAFNASNASLAGTIVVTGANNTITTTNAGGTAGGGVNIRNMTIGASGVTFKSVTVNNGGILGSAGFGIAIDTTGASGSFSVTGNTGSVTEDGSGGTISFLNGADSTTGGNGTGIYLNATTNPSIKHVNLHDFQNYAVMGNSVSGFTLQYCTINGTNGNNNASPFKEGSVLFNELTGSANIRNSHISGAKTDNLNVTNALDASVLNRLTVDTVTFGANDATTGNSAVNVAVGGTGTLNMTVNACTFTSSRSVQLQYTMDATAPHGDVIVTGNNFSDSQTQVAGAAGVFMTTGGAGSNPTLTYNIQNNTISDMIGSAIAIGKGIGTGSVSGTIDNNILTGNATSGGGNGIQIVHVGGGTDTAHITNNAVHKMGTDGILLQIGDSTSGGNGTLNATVTGNVVDTQFGPFPNSAFELNAGTTSAPLDAPTVCLSLGGVGSLKNTFTATTGFSPYVNDVRLRERFNATTRLPGYGGATTDDAAVATFEAGQNTTTSGASSFIVSHGANSATWIGGAACP